LDVAPGTCFLGLLAANVGAKTALYTATVLGATAEEGLVAIFLWVGSEVAL